MGISALSCDGQAVVPYSWGWGQYGQLGHGDERDEPAPRVIQFLSDKNVVHIASSGSRSVHLPGLINAVIARLLLEILRSGTPFFA